MNKENYKRPVGGRLGTIHDPNKYEWSIPGIGEEGEPRLNVIETKKSFYVEILDSYDQCAGREFNPGLLLDLALALVKKAKADGIDTDRW
jgi:hypothetical protein